MSSPQAANNPAFTVENILGTVKPWFHKLEEFVKPYAKGGTSTLQMAPVGVTQYRGAQIAVSAVGHFITSDRNTTPQLLTALAAENTRQLRVDGARYFIDKAAQKAFKRIVSSKCTPAFIYESIFSIQPSNGKPFEVRVFAKTMSAYDELAGEAVGFMKQSVDNVLSLGFRFSASSIQSTDNTQTSITAFDPSEKPKQPDGFELINMSRTMANKLAQFADMADGFADRRAIYSLETDDRKYYYVIKNPKAKKATNGMIFAKFSEVLGRVMPTQKETILTIYDNGATESQSIDSLIYGA